MPLNNSSKGSPASTAIGRYLAGVEAQIESDKKDVEAEALVNKLSPADRKRLPKDFVQKLILLMQKGRLF